MYDLYKIHREKILSGKLSQHPSQWLKSQAEVLSGEFFSKTSGLDNNQQFPEIVINGIKATDSKSIMLLASRKYPKHATDCFLTDKRVACEYKEYRPINNDIEKLIQCGLEILYGYDIEVPTDVGAIDCLSKNEIIEIKKAKEWKHGLGQLLSYGYYYQDYSKKLCLFSSVEDEIDINLIRDICSQYEVKVIHEVFPNKANPHGFAQSLRSFALR